jgi:hypothetical protein
VLIKHSLRRVNVHVDGHGSLVNGTRVRGFWNGSILVLVIHVCLRTAGSKY